MISGIKTVHILNFINYIIFIILIATALFGERINDKELRKYLKLKMNDKIFVILLILLIIFTLLSKFYLHNHVKKDIYLKVNKALFLGWIAFLIALFSGMGYTIALAFITAFAYYHFNINLT